jgi:tRNA(fMet)-specific endonuclease VapC
MGIILDSSVLIALERKGKSSKYALQELYERFDGEEIALSIISVVELAHGIARADSEIRRAKRQEYLDDLTATLDIHPVTIPVALRAGQIDGENTAKGIRVATADLLIGVTALELGYRVATSNTRHFQMIPGLVILSV